MMDIQNFIVAQRKKYYENRLNDRLVFEYGNLYQNVSHEILRELFAVLHADLVELFEAMNRRLPTADGEAHYWANESRGLLNAISITNALQNQLEGSAYAFKLDPYYADLFQKCSKWLSASGGSTIPPHTPEVEIYYIKSIFHTVSPSRKSELHDVGERLALLGSGGFGEVYRYRHPDLDMDFAVKVFSPMFVSNEDEVEGERRFFREAKMLFLLNHPNIVRVYDVGRIGGKPFMRMELVEGMNLHQLHEKYGNLPFKNAGKAISQILQGLQHAHNNRIIHRDLKPAM